MPLSTEEARKVIGAAHERAAQLGIRVLEQCRSLDQHVDANLIANRHLVDEAAEIPLELCHAAF